MIGEPRWGVSSFSHILRAPDLGSDPGKMSTGYSTRETNRRAVRSLDSACEERIPTLACFLRKKTAFSAENWAVAGWLLTVVSVHALA